MDTRERASAEDRGVEGMEWRGLQTGLGYLQGTGVSIKMDLQGHARLRCTQKQTYRKQTLIGTYSKDVLVKKKAECKA